MKPFLSAYLLLVSLIVGCSGAGLASAKPEVHLEIVNKSSRRLDNALIRFGKTECEWGDVGKTFTAGYGFFPHPVTPDAELHWDENGKHRVEKLDLRKIYPPGKSGRLTFTVFDDRVEVTFREKTPKP